MANPDQIAPKNADGERHCDVPCFTSHMRCPPMHACRARGTFTSSPWVCEWTGE